MTPDFFISVAPTSPTVQAGFGADTTIVLESISEFNDAVNLSIASTSQCLGSTCPSWSLKPGTVALSSGGTGWATLSFSAPPEEFETPATYWSINLTGTSGSLSHSVLVTFTVLPPDFTISVDQISGWGKLGANATIILRSIGGFGTVNVTSSPSSCSASNCPLSTWNLSPTSLTLSTGETAQTTLTFSAPPPSGELTAVTYYGSITATSGRLSHSIGIYFTVFPRNFTITVNPSTLTIVRGQSAYAIVGDSSWFATAISVSINPTIKKGPSVTWPYYLPHCTDAGEQCRCYNCGPFLLMSTNSTTHPGTYTVSVTASNGWFTHTTTLTLLVVPNTNDPPKIR